MTDLLGRIFEDLSRPATQEKAADDLKAYVQGTLPGISSEVAWKIWDEKITRPLEKLVNARDEGKVVGGLLAIEQVVSLRLGDSADPNTLYRRFYRYARAALPNSNQDTMRLAAKLMGHIVEHGGLDCFDEIFIEHQVHDAIALIQENKLGLRHAGLLVLCELAQNSSHYFRSHIPLVARNLFNPLRDTSALVCFAAENVLAQCIDSVKGQEREMDSSVLHELLQEAQAGLKSKSVKFIHCSLVIYRVLFVHSGMFMKDVYVSTTESIIRLLYHKDAVVTNTAASLFAILAEYDFDTFLTRFMHPVMNRLLEILQKTSEKDTVFIAIGTLSRAMGGDINFYSESIMKHVKVELQAYQKKPGSTDGADAVFTCLKLLAAAVGPNLTHSIRSQLDLMFGRHLDQTLIDALKEITRCVPSLFEEVQLGLLNKISVILCGQNYAQLGAPGIVSQPAIKYLNGHTLVNDVCHSNQSIYLAMEVLDDFDFRGHILIEFIHNCALPYLDHPLSKIRGVSALSCCNVLIREPIKHQVSKHSLQIIGEFLNKLLSIAITDSDSKVRQIILKKISKGFDKHLTQPDLVRMLIMALNDDDFSNREIVAELLGHLAKQNSVYIVPFLQRTLLQMMAELKHSTAVHSREECSKILKLLVANSQWIAKSQASAMIQELIPHIERSNDNVASNAICCIGELALIAEDDAIASRSQLFRLLLPHLTSPISIMRCSSLKALGQICSSTGYVIEPLRKHPHLMKTLQNLIKKDPSLDVQQEALKLVGILGAIDPYVILNEDEELIIAAEANTLSANNLDILKVVIHSLLDILNERSHNNHHNQAVETIVTVFKSCRLECIQFIPKIIPSICNVVRRPVIVTHQDFLLSQLSTLLDLIGEHIRNHVTDIVDLTVDMWSKKAIHPQIMSLIQVLGNTLDWEQQNKEFPKLFPMMLNVLEDSRELQRTKMNVLDALLSFGLAVETFLQVIIPVIMGVLAEQNSSVALQERVVQTITGLIQKTNLAVHAPRIIPPLIQTLTSKNLELSTVIMDALCALAAQMGTDFDIFIPSIDKILLKSKLQHAQHKSLLERLHVREPPLSQSGFGGEHSIHNDLTTTTKENEKESLSINQEHLLQIWDIKKLLSKDDWDAWIHNVSVAYVEEAPSIVLRDCLKVVRTNKKLALFLFNISFWLCWHHLRSYEKYQYAVSESIQNAITQTSIPQEVALKLLDLVEYMEQNDYIIQISNDVLGEEAKRHNAYAKALHYKELVYFSTASPPPNIIEDLIEINTDLQHNDAAFGILTVAMKHHDISDNAKWYEQLGKWHHALAKHEESLPSNSNASMGRMQCLHKLGEWEELADHIKTHWNTSNTALQREMAIKGADAAWSLNDWNSMKYYTSAIKQNCFEESFFKAVIDINQNKVESSQEHINKAREFVVSKLSQVPGGSYVGAYEYNVKAQLLTELEEIIQYNQNGDNLKQQHSMIKMWGKRLQGCLLDVEYWQQILKVRTLALKPGGDSSLAMWTRFINLCLKSDKISIAEKTVDSLMGLTQYTQASPEIVYAQIKVAWVGQHASTSREEWYNHLQTFTSKLEKEILTKEMKILLARCYFRLGEWKELLHPQLQLNHAQQIVSYFAQSTKYNPKWCKAWQSWAVANLNIVGRAEVNQLPRDENISKNFLVTCATEAIRGFIKAIALSEDDDSVLQNTLRILILWFKFGIHDDISHEMDKLIKNFNPDNWLEVVPQIIARMQTPTEANENICRQIDIILSSVGRSHPQALVYSLLVASQSARPYRQKAALSVMNRMREHSDKIVEQALLVSRELVRIAILWLEMWHEGIDKAFAQHGEDPDSTCKALAPLYQLLEEPVTIREKSFAHVFGLDLREALECFNRYRSSGNRKEVDRAWEIYRSVWLKIDEQLKPSQSQLHLSYVSDELSKICGLELAVPGTYRSGKDVVRIAKFHDVVTIFDSKQRPRKVVIKGSDGIDYSFILKGREDLRQDERVMQFFGLVNNRLNADVSSSRRRLQIHRYAVIPIAPNVGLLEYVKETDKMQDLICDYRRSQNLMIYLEDFHIKSMNENYESLPLSEKVKIFKYALDNTTGQDLYRAYWMKSNSSEHWLERRVNYTRSLAVSSMVGYILGLGDRHPSNILFERRSGMVVHIDFGDCFEVAMRRAEVPEKVPFRLTRMLQNALEVSGIHGGFKVTSEISMRVLRDNRESLMAVLEALVYDPLVTWLLVEKDKRDIGGVSQHNTPPENRSKLRADESRIFMDDNIQNSMNEMRNERAVAVLERVKQKLMGRDFNPESELSVEDQVEMLINEAMNLENLCQAYYGWFPYW